MGTIYALHFGGSRRYIGSAINLKRRLHEHWSALRRGVHHSRFLQRAVNKHGLENLKVQVLLDGIEPALLLPEEQKFIDAHKGQLYNCSPTAGSRLGCKDTPAETARKRAAWLGNTFRLGKRTAKERLPVKPWKRPISLIIPVLTDLAKTKSFQATGANVGMQAQNVRSIYRNAHTDISAAMDGRMKPRPWREIQPFIHPDWFDILEMTR